MGFAAKIGKISQVLVHQRFTKVKLSWNIFVMPQPVAPQWFMSYSRASSFDCWPRRRNYASRSAPAPIFAAVEACRAEAQSAKAGNETQVSVEKCVYLESPHVVCYILYDLLAVPFLAWNPIPAVQVGKTPPAQAFIGGAFQRIEGP
jgi:hypothetical protein